MSDNQKQQLVKLGADVLADALLKLAEHDNAAENMVKRMIATPADNIKRFRAKLAGIKRSRRFIPCRESGGLAHELSALLEDLKAGVDDPRTGADLTAAFYEADKGALGNCDDSNGHVGDVFRFDAKDLFVAYAVRCPDKDWLAKRLLKLSREDDYGVRDALIDCAAQFLPEENLRTMISSFQDLADQQDEVHKKRHWLYLVESLARQIKDAPLFEKTRIASWGSLPTAACMDISRVYLESGDAQTALSWIERISENETYQAQERDRLLVDIHGRLGDAGKQADAAWRIFRRHRSVDSLQELLAVIGEDQRNAVITGEVAVIVGDNGLSLSDATFLMAVGRIDEAENYLIERADQLNGDFYGGLLPLAEAMEAEGRFLAATMICRALLDSILRRAQTKTYAYGVRYLKKLDRLAKSIYKWRDIEDHGVYSEHLRQQHGRKSSFWSRYE